MGRRGWLVIAAGRVWAMQLGLGESVRRGRRIRHTRRVGLATALAAAVLCSIASSASAYTPGLGTGPGYCARAQSGGYTLQGSPSINDVYPCGPLPINNGDSGPSIPTFWPLGGASGGFQCTEFAQRYLYSMSHGDLDNFNNLSGEVFASRASSEFGFKLTSSTSGQLPKVGDIISEAHSQSDPTYNVGDVAVVAAVSRTSITIVGENDTSSGYNTIEINGPNNWVINPHSQYQYTYFQWIDPAQFTAPTGNGSFVSYGSSIYRIVGGAPLHITNCSAIPGGCGTPTPVSSLSQFSPVIADGSAIVEYDDGSGGGFWSAVGGTILHVASCYGADAPICAHPVTVNYASIAAYVAQHPTVVNGTAIYQLDSHGGGFVSAAGGALLGVSSCSGVDAPVCKGGVQETSAGIASYQAQHPTVANGTAIYQLDSQGGAFYAAAGGALLHVTSCSGVDAPVCRAGVQETAPGIASYQAQHPAVANGTVLRYVDHGSGYDIVNGGQVVAVNCTTDPAECSPSGSILLPYQTIENYAAAPAARPKSGPSGGRPAPGKPQARVVPRHPRTRGRGRVHHKAKRKHSKRHSKRR